MIEGLRSLPWLQQAARSDPSSVVDLLDCTKCMSTNTAQVRRYMGCGFEPADPACVTWVHGGNLGDRPTTCPGYTTKLPVVREVSRARFYLHKGSLAQFAPAPGEQLLQAIEVLEGAESEVMQWVSDNPKQGAV